MGKHLKVFKTLEEYEAVKDSLILPNTSYIENTNQIFYSKLIPSYEFGDYLHATGIVDTTPSSDVIGICVIPTSHYGKARFMSVTMLEGCYNENIYSSNINLDSPYTYIWTYDAMGNASASSTISKYCPTDYPHDYYSYMNNNGYNWNGYEPVSITINTDDIAQYWMNNGDYPIYLASPFLSDGSLNPNYIANPNSSEKNILTDIDGKSNTDVLKTYNSDAAIKCNNFDPGYGAGQWYLPAVGEICYIEARFNALNTMLYDLGCTTFNDVNYAILASSFNNDTHPFQLFVRSGWLNAFDTYKNTPLLIRPFIML